MFIDDDLEEPVMQETIDENVEVTAEYMLQSSKKAKQNRSTKLVQDMAVRWNSTLAMI